MTSFLRTLSRFAWLPVLWAVIVASLPGEQHRVKAFVTNLFWGLLLVAQIIHWLAHKRTNYAPEQYFFRRFISWSAKLGVLLLFCLVAGYSVQHSLRFSEIAGGIALCLAGGLGIAGYMYASDQPAKTIQALDLDQGKDKAV